MRSRRHDWPRGALQKRRAYQWEVPLWQPRKLRAERERATAKGLMDSDTPAQYLGKTGRAGYLHSACVVEEEVAKDTLNGGREDLGPNGSTPGRHLSATAGGLCYLRRLPTNVTEFSGRNCRGRENGRVRTWR